MPDRFTTPSIPHSFISASARAMPSGPMCVWTSMRRKRRAAGFAGAGADAAAGVGALPRRRRAEAGDGGAGRVNGAGFAAGGWFALAGAERRDHRPRHHRPQPPVKSRLGRGQDLDVAGLAARFVLGRGCFGVGPVRFNLMLIFSDCAPLRDFVQSEPLIIRSCASKPSLRTVMACAAVGSMSLLEIRRRADRAAVDHHLGARRRRRDLQQRLLGRRGLGGLRRFGGARGRGARGRFGGRCLFARRRRPPASRLVRRGRGRRFGCGGFALPAARLRPAVPRATSRRRRARLFAPRLVGLLRLRGRRRVAVSGAFSGAATGGVSVLASVGGAGGGLGARRYCRAQAARRHRAAPSRRGPAPAPSRSRPPCACRTRACPARRPPPPRPPAARRRRSCRSCGWSAGTWRRCGSGRFRSRGPAGPPRCAWGPPPLRRRRAAGRSAVAVASGRGAVQVRGQRRVERRRRAPRRLVLSAPTARRRARAPTARPHAAWPSDRRRCRWRSGTPDPSGNELV